MEESRKALFEEVQVLNCYIWKISVDRKHFTSIVKDPEVSAKEDRTVHVNELIINN